MKSKRDELFRSCNWARKSKDREKKDESNIKVANVLLLERIVILTLYTFSYY